MATVDREEAVALLRGGATGVREWNEQFPSLHQLPTLRGADFRGIDLRRADLRGADLGGADLSEADLRRAGLEEADLGGANLRNSGLLEVDLSGANLREADLRGANLRRANLRRADLGGARLSEADLRQAYLEGTDLSEADLRQADLRATNLGGADLSRTDLRGANLREADLRQACLRQANLRGAHLNRAHLGQADLREADLGEANLRDAGLGYTKFRNTTLARLDLSSAQGLSQIFHDGPSVLDQVTLRRSRELPTVFLRGCGLIDWEIEAARLYHTTNPGDLNDLLYKIVELRLESPISYYSVFISHSSKDKSLAKALHDQLQEQGIRCWLDEKQLLPGEKILDSIDHGIRNWDKVILCCSEASLASSWWVEDEIDRCLAKERRIRSGEGRTVRALIPLDLDGYIFVWDHALAETIKQRKIADFTAGEEALRGEPFEALIRALRADDGGKEPPPVPKL